MIERITPLLATVMLALLNAHGPASAQPSTFSPAPSVVEASFSAEPDITEMRHEVTIAVQPGTDGEEPLLPMQAPAITLQGDSPIVICVGSVYTDPGARAVDSFGGDITGRIVVNNPVDTDRAGNYVVTYDVTDGTGNAARQVSRTVVVNDGNQTIRIQTTYQYDDIGRVRRISRQVQK